MTEKEGIALKHLFDKVDYFGQPDGEPNVTFNMQNLVLMKRVMTNQTVEVIAIRTKIAAAALSVWRRFLQFNYKMICKNRYAYQKLDHMNMATYTICQHVGYVDAYI